MSLLGLAALALGLSPHAAAAEPAERRYAIVVGSNEGLGPDLPLRYAESDAARFAELLLNVGGVLPSDLVLLRGADADELRGVLHELHGRMSRELQTGQRSTLFVYYSGHADGQDLHLEHSELPLRELRADLEDMPSDLVVVVLDACQAAEILRSKGGVPAAPFPITVPETARVEGLAVLTAAAVGEDAQESDRLQGGVFTHHLLAGLSGAADSSGDHRVTLQEAFRYAHARTLATTSRAPVVQHPSYAFDLQGQTDVALTVLDGARRTGRLLLVDPGIYVIFDSAETRLVAEVEVPAGGVLALPDGTYQVRRRLPDRVDEGTVTVRVGEETRLSTTEMRSRPYGQTARRGETTQVHGALALTAGGGVQGPLRDGLSIAPQAELGLRLDLPWLTLIGRAAYAQSTAENRFLDLEQHVAGGELAALRLVDLGPASFGLGLSGGVAGVLQRFETDGVAPDRLSLAGHLGPVGRAELAVRPRLTIGLELATDITLLPASDAEDTVLDAVVVPRGAIDVTTWIR